MHTCGLRAHSDGLAISFFDISGSVLSRQQWRQSTRSIKATGPADRPAAGIVWYPHLRADHRQGPWP